MPSGTPGSSRAPLQRAPPSPAPNSPQQTTRWKSPWLRRNRSMSTLVTVRPVAPADFDKWLLLWQGYNLFYGRPSLPAEITQMTWSRLFDAYEPVHALVAERNLAVPDAPDQGNELLGLVHYL